MSPQIAPDCATPPPSYAQVDRVTGKGPIDVVGSLIDQTQSSRYSGNDNDNDNDKHLVPVNDGGFPEVVVSGDTSHKTTSHTTRSNPPTMTHANHSSVSISKNTDAPSIIGDGEDLTVTPLKLLDEQADWVDCPFCRKRVQTRVKYEASRQTHYAATGLFLTTLGGVAVPYAKKWRNHISHICTNCDKKVAHKKYGKEMVPLGTPEHLRQVSRFVSGSPAPSRQSSN